MIVEALSPVVTEEWGHFRMVLEEMKKRGLQLGRQRKDEYVNKLLENEPRGLNRQEALLHKLMICALIEARSCERFRLLSENLEDAALRKFYYKFMVSEAGHYHLFIELAIQYFGKDKTQAAWQKWLSFEEQILHSFAPRGDRMH